MIRLLVKAGADVHAKSILGLSLIETAEKLNQHDIVTILKEHIDSG